MKDLHNIQMLILRELLFCPSAKFSQLNIQGMSSDNFSYHINTLVKDGYVTKDDQMYNLTVKGKEYANRMDTDQAQLEMQPKVAVMIIPSKIENGTKYLLVQERTKEPYFGYKGFITGKIRYGEKVLETARRELLEEAGLMCEDFHIKRLVRNLVVLEEKGNLVEDKMFYIVSALNPTGKCIDTRSGKNYWVTEEEFHSLDKRYYDEENVFKYSQEAGEMDFIEGTFLVKEF